MNKPLYISTEYLRKQTIINDNVQGEILESVIKQVQETEIQSLLGTSLYYKINGLINDSSITGTTNSNYKELLDDYIIPCLLQYCVWNSSIYLNYKFTNKAINTQKSDDSEPLGLDELKYLRDELRNTAQFYGERLVKQLKCNTDLYSEYLECTDGGIHPDNTAFFNGIFIPT
jgi:hypothetical protein